MAAGFLRLGPWVPPDGGSLPTLLPVSKRLPAPFLLAWRLVQWTKSPVVCLQGLRPELIVCSLLACSEVGALPLQKPGERRCLSDGEKAGGT